MITLYFVRTWFKALFVTLLVVAIEYGVTGHARGWFYVALVVTIAGFVGFSVLMFQDWKSSRANGSAYRYDIIRDVTRPNR
jgi:hypothetical protein